MKKPVPVIYVIVKRRYRFKAIKIKALFIVGVLNQDTITQIYLTLRQREVVVLRALELPARLPLTPIDRVVCNNVHDIGFIPADKVNMSFVLTCQFNPSFVYEIAHLGIGHIWKACTFPDCIDFAISVLSAPDFRFSDHQIDISRTEQWDVKVMVKAIALNPKGCMFPEIVPSVIEAGSVHH